MNGVDLLAVIVNACGLGGGLLGIAVVATQARQPEDRARAFALLGILAVDVASSIFDLTAGAIRYPGLVWASLLLWPWIPVCLWINVDALIRDRGAATGRYRRHFAIARSGTVCLLPYFTLPASTRSGLAQGIASAGPHLELAVAGVTGRSGIPCAGGDNGKEGTPICPDAKRV